MPAELRRGLVYQGHDGTYRHLREANPATGTGFFRPVGGTEGRRITLERFARWARRALSPAFGKAFLAEMDRAA